MGNVFSEPFDAPACLTPITASKGNLASALGGHVAEFSRHGRLNRPGLEEDLESLEATISVFQRCSRLLALDDKDTASRSVCERLDPTLQQAQQSLLALIEVCVSDQVLIERLLGLHATLVKALEQYTQLDASDEQEARKLAQEAREMAREANSLASAEAARAQIAEEVARARRESKTSAELMQGHSNVARSVLSEELRVLDDEACAAVQEHAAEELSRRLEEAATIAAEAKETAHREAERVISDAENEAARVLAEASAQAEARRALATESASPNGSRTMPARLPREQLAAMLAEQKAQADAAATRLAPAPASE